MKRWLVFILLCCSLTFYAIAFMINTPDTVKQIENIDTGIAFYEEILGNETEQNDIDRQNLQMLKDRKLNKQLKIAFSTLFFLATETLLVFIGINEIKNNRKVVAG